MARLKPRIPEELPDDPRDLYVTTELSCDQISARYEGRRGTSKKQLNRRCAAEKWAEQRREYKRQVASRLQEKLVEEASDRAVKTLSQLNEEHLSRAQRLIQVNLMRLDREADTLTPADLRRLTQNIIDLQEAERLYHNHNPRAPVEEKHDDSRDDTVLLELFSDLLETNPDSES